MIAAIGQDSHRFDFENPEKPLMLGGVHIPNTPGLKGNSDADVVLHAITNAISGISGVNILGKISDDLCQQGLTDSQVYLHEALKYLTAHRLTHISISLECKRPKITPHIPAMKTHIAQLLNLAEANIGLTATSGEGLTDFGRGEGIQALVIASAVPL